MECHYIEDNYKTTCSHFIVGALVILNYVSCIVLENAAPNANDMVAADPSSTVVHSLRSKQNSLLFTFQISYVLYGSMRLLFFPPEKESECF